MQKLMNGRQRRRAADIANELLERIADKHNIDLYSLRSKGNFAHLVAARRDYCIIGRKMEIPTKVLGGALNVHHTTVTYHANLNYRTVKNARRPPRPTTKEDRNGRHPQTAQGHRRTDGMALEGCSNAR